MNFYIKLCKKVINNEKVSIFQFTFFLLRLFLILFIVYKYSSYYLFLLLLYRILVSNLSVIDNSIFFSKNDMYLFGFNDNSLLKMFIFQKLFLNKFIYRIFYVVGILSTLIYIKGFCILSLVLLLELVFFYLEYELFRVNHLIHEKYFSFKVIGEVSAIALVSVGIVIFKDVSVFLLKYLVEAFLTFLLAYYIYIKLIILFLKKIKQPGKRIFSSFFYKKIDIFTFKELKLFGKYFLSNIFIMITSIAFFLMEKNEFNSYAVLLIIATSVLFIHKKKGIVSNFKNDSFFLNKKLFLKDDNLLIIKKKFTSYLKMSLLVKVPLLIMVNYLMGDISMRGIFCLIILILLLIINEFNSFYVIDIFNFILHYTLRYMLSLLIFIYIYTNKYLLALFLVVIFLVKEFYSLNRNFFKVTRDTVR